LKLLGNILATILSQYSPGQTLESHSQMRKIFELEIDSYIFVYLLESIYMPCPSCTNACVPENPSSVAEWLLHVVQRSSFLVGISSIDKTVVFDGLPCFVSKFPGDISELHARKLHAVPSPYSALIFFSILNINSLPAPADNIADYYFPIA
jgi:hypothetical protein